jgi:DNA-binding HxlR family transcriptional regulator
MLWDVVQKSTTCCISDSGHRSGNYERDSIALRTAAVGEGHWKLPILFRLLDGTRRFGELRRHLPAATQRMLTLHLRELERDGLIHREVYGEVPPKVEYSLTDTGRSLEPLLRFMSQWGHANRGALVAALQSLAASTADPTAVGHDMVTDRTAARDGGACAPSHCDRNGRP